MNDYYTPSGTPTFLSRALSVQQRNEDASVSLGFDKLPDPDVLGGSGQNYAVDTGTTNTIVVALNPQITAAFDGMELVVKAKNAPTGAATVTAGALVITSITRFDGSAIQANDWVTNQIISLRYNATTGTYQYVPPFNGTATVSVPLSDGSPILYNAIDPTKLLQFTLANLTTGTTRLVTVPDKDVLLDSTRRIARTSDIQLIASNIGDFIDITTGSFTQTFAAGMPADWYAFIRNSSLTAVTIPSSDGVTNWKMYPGESRLFMWDGTNFYSDWISPFLYTPSVTENFIWPPGYAEIEADLVGGGGGGGSGRRGAAATKRNGGSPGGAPGRVIRVARGLAAGTNVLITLGAAGVGGAVQTVNATNGNTGTAGGNTSFGSFGTAFGGAAGLGGTSNGTGQGSSGSGSISAGISSSTAAVGGDPQSNNFGFSTASNINNIGEGGGGLALAVSGANTEWGGAGSGAAIDTTTAVLGGSSVRGVSAGGVGGWVTSANAMPAIAGTAGLNGTYTVGGGAAGGTCGGAPTAGAAGAAATNAAFVGNSGGGGGSSITVAAAAGGAGGYPGGAGGGGGASLDGNNSGAGGNGAEGRAIIKGVA